MEGLRRLSPGNFGFVMATGVVSIILNDAGWFRSALLFLIMGVIAWIGLTALFIYRLFDLGREVLYDLKDVQRMFKYLTFGAGANTIAVASILAGYDTLGGILGTVGVISTIVLVYALFCALFFHVQTPIQRISPFWLLLAIACNSSGIVLTTLWNGTVIQDVRFILVAFTFWTFGVFIYITLMTLNLYRFLFVPFEGKDMDPCYWTCMGAAAIAAVDGSQCILLSHPPEFLLAVKPFVQGMVLFLWGWGTAWIPILILMELWKVAYFKVPFRYQPSRWAMVFPLGMYTVATEILKQSLGLTFLGYMGQICLGVTLAAWCLIALQSRFNPFSEE